MQRLSDLAIYGMGSMREATMKGRNPMCFGPRFDPMTVLQRRRLRLHRSGVWGDRAGWLLEVRRGQGRCRKQSIGLASFEAQKAGVRMNNAHRMNFNEYMVTLDKPLGIRFVQTLDGKVYVDALVREGNAHNSRLIMVGDVLKKTNAVFGDAMGDVEDFSCTMRAIKGCNGPISFVLERPVIPVLVQPLISRSTESSFNCGHVAIATWNLNILTSDLKPCQSYTIKEGKVGFAVYTSKFLQPRGLKTLARLRSVKYENINYNDSVDEHASNTYSTTCLSEVGMPYEVIASFSDEPGGKVEWTHGNFPIEEYKHAVERAKNDLSYNHSLGMQYTKITKHILVGSCIQTQSDVNNLATNLIVVATGAVEHEEIAQLVEKLFADLSTNPTTGADLVQKQPITFTGSQVHMKDGGLSLAHIAVGFLGAPWTDPDSIPLLVMQAMLGCWSPTAAVGKYMGSELAQKVSTNNLAECIASFNTNYADAGLFGVYAIAQPDKVESLSQTIMNEFTRLIYRFVDEELIRARNLLKGSLLLHLDGTSPIAEDIGRQLLTYGRRIPLAEIFARIDAVDADTIKRVAMRFIYDKDIAMIVKGPAEFLPDYTWFRRRTYWLRK